MRHSHRHRHQDPAEDRESGTPVRRPDRHPTGGVVSPPEVLRLQRDVGNAVTARLLTVQRAVTETEQEQTSRRPMVHLPGGAQWEAVNNAGRVDGIVLSGHGSWTSGTPDVRVPRGTRVHFYCHHGVTVEDADGGTVETGGDIAPIMTKTGGHLIRDYTLHRPDDLRIQGSPVVATPAAGGGYDIQFDPTQPLTVPVPSLTDPLLRGHSITFSQDIRLSVILTANMGHVHMAACRHLDIPYLHGRTRNQS